MCVCVCHFLFIAGCGNFVKPCRGRHLSSNLLKNCRRLSEERRMIDGGEEKIGHSCSLSSSDPPLQELQPTLPHPTSSAIQPTPPHTYLAFGAVCRAPDLTFHVFIFRVHEGEKGGERKKKVHIPEDTWSPGHGRRRRRERITSDLYQSGLLCSTRK